ncbi:MAG: hypothetical protein ACOH2S_03490 [Janthinobacterium svalbardensis]
MQAIEKTDGLIHLGVLGMGIPRIYNDVVAKIISNQLAVESILVKYVEEKLLKPKSNQFISRLNSVEKSLGEKDFDWSIDASRKLNSVRNKCAHIDGGNYQSIELRIESSLDNFIKFVELHNERLPVHKMSDFEWACIMTYQRLYELLDLDYPPLELGGFEELPSALKRHFSEK